MNRPVEFQDLAKISTNIIKNLKIRPAGTTRYLYRNKSFLVVTIFFQLWQGNELVHFTTFINNES
jgi:hypothetical protein